MAQSMFERYGGFASISKIVMAFYDKVLDSDRLAPFFDGVDMRRLVDHQTKFVSTVMGGPSSYTDQALRQVHAPLRIDNASFNETVDLLAQTLREFKIAPDDVAQIVQGVRARQRYIVQDAG